MVTLVSAGGVALLLAAWITYAAGRRRARGIIAAARTEARGHIASAQLEAAAIRRAAATEAKSETLDLRTGAEAEFSAASADLAAREATLTERAADAEDAHREVTERREALEERKRTVDGHRDHARELGEQTAAIRAKMRTALEQRASVAAGELAESLVQRWVDDARAEAAFAVRTAGEADKDPETGRIARRVIDIAGARYQNHFLTERPISNVPIGGGVAELLTAEDSRVLAALQEIANIQLHVSETGQTVRLEGLDGVGREVARRALGRMSKRPDKCRGIKTDPAKWAADIREKLEREIVGLGRKAFSVLEIPRAHPEIVELVGALNYRTSYTQNQWLHAVEASFLAGMMASELGLDIKIARRATLLHDIGKALTHKIDGSHAVIGADIARRLGEDEVIANAIGAHHDDEPPASAYAHITAGADAMSGARPGARREIGELYNTRLDDLERIGRRRRGVDRAFAVHGGRELRVYVREGQVTDLEAVEMSTEIADQIADEMTFPGQIKVTVIRSYEAVSVAS